MATNKIYYTPGTTITFAASGGDVVWTPQNIAVINGRISAVWDRGAGSLPARYLWRCKTRWVATPGLGNTLRLYLVTSSASADASVTDGNLTFGDATFTSENALLLNCKAIGGVVSEAADHSYCASGMVCITERYVALACWNGSGTKALTNTAGDHVCTFTPIPDDIQAAS